MKTKTDNGRAQLGFVLIIIGVAFIFRILGLLPDTLSDILFSWQMLLIAIGTFNLINKKYTPAIILLTIGVVFMVPEIIYIDYTYRRLFWPIILVVTGVVLIVRRNKGFDFPDLISRNNKTDYIDHTSVFGGNKVIYTSKVFRGGRITSIFGGSEVNFKSADIAEENAVVDVFTIFGGTKLIVPNDWNVQIDVIAIFGGFTDKRFISAESNSSDKILFVKGFTMFGGGDVRN
ncbi:MAG: DUF5668 domain-containing protein [Bacteroidota bacterium]